MFLSVIIPIYNVEDYLRACIESVLNQTFTDYEVLLVDDGSPDGCATICDEYASKYANVHAFHKENGGLSDARNFGLERAKGDWVLFLDSDDYYGKPDFFQKIKDIADEKDCTVINYLARMLLYNDESVVLSEKPLYDIKKLEAIKDNAKLLSTLIETDLLNISACYKAVKRSFLLENELWFKKGLVSEDVDWSLRMYTSDFKMAFLNYHVYYCRRQRPNSITSGIKAKNLYDLCSIVDSFAESFKNSNNPCENVLLNYVAYQYTVLCGLIARISDKKVRREITKKIKKSSWLFKYNLSGKVKMASKCYKIFGGALTIKILGFYIKHRVRRKKI